jgi:excisionase family DNA binding protein
LARWPVILTKLHVLFLVWTGTAMVKVVLVSNQQSPRKDLNVPSILTVPEVADIFRVSRKTVFGWLSTGKLPHIRTPGRGIRVKREHIEALLNAGAAQPR